MTKITPPVAPRQVRLVFIVGVKESKHRPSIVLRSEPDRVFVLYGQHVGNGQEAIDVVSGSPEWKRMGLDTTTHFRKGNLQWVKLEPDLVKRVLGMCPPQQFTDALTYGNAWEKANAPKPSARPAALPAVDGGCSSPALPPETTAPETTAPALSSTAPTPSEGGE